MSTESMLKFIEENKSVYTGKMNLDNIAEADEATISKAYRNIKTKLWNIGRKAPKQSFVQVSDLNTPEDVQAMRKFISDYLEALDAREAEIRENYKRDLETKIADLQNQLESLG